MIMNDLWGYSIDLHFFFQSKILEFELQQNSLSDRSREAFSRLPQSHGLLSAVAPARNLFEHSAVARQLWIHFEHVLK